jgi:exopolysaccharide production protein ExoZ
MQNATRLSSFDALRGIAILGVVGFHTAGFSPTNIAFVDSLFGVGKLGVQLFFFISALTMCHMWEQRSDENHRTAKFYIRRFMRIAPLFWLAVVFYIAVNGMGPSFWAHDGMTSLDIGLTMLFLHGFWPHAINNVVPGGWSIAVEMTFYLLFPLVIGVIGSRRRIYLALAGAIFLLYHFWWENLLGTMLATGVFGNDPELAGNFLYFNFLGQCPIFLIGCYLHFAFKDGFGRGEVIAAALFSLVGAAIGHIMLIVSAGLSALIYLGVTRSMRSALLEKFGQNSYAVYLAHFIVVQIVGDILPAHTGPAALLIRFAVVAAISFALARIIHNTIERRVAPLTKWVVAGIDRKGSQAATA